MSDIFPPDAYMKDPQTQHRRQSLWQIYFPLAVGFAVFLVLGIMVVVSQETGNPELSRWAAIATIWLVLPLLAFGIATLLVNLLFIFLFAKINNSLPDYGRLARFYVFRLSLQIQALANKLTTPGINFQSNLAGWKKILTIFQKQ
ncbi:MAG: hypothetical protein AB9891_15030 [Anaerolineaceae bacterium]